MDRPVTNADFAFLAADAASIDRERVTVTNGDEGPAPPTRLAAVVRVSGETSLAEHEAMAHALGQHMPAVVHWRLRTHNDDETRITAVGDIAPLAEIREHKRPIAVVIDGQRYPLADGTYVPEGDTDG